MSVRFGISVSGIPLENLSESSTRCFEESWSNGHDEREGRENPGTPSDEVESLHQLSEAELCNQEGSLPSSVHRSNRGPIGMIELLLLPRWIFGLQSDCYSSRQSRDNDVHKSFWHIPFRRMPFGLCNAPATFQRCMTAFFSDFLDEGLEVFMNDFSVFGNDFESCLAHMTKILEVCVRKQLVLSWEKFHFMVWEGVVDVGYFRV